MQHADLTHRNRLALSNDKTALDCSNCILVPNNPSNHDSDLSTSTYSNPYAVINVDEAPKVNCQYKFEDCFTYATTKLPVKSMLTALSAGIALFGISSATLTTLANLESYFSPTSSLAIGVCSSLISIRLLSSIRSSWVEGRR